MAYVNEKKLRKEGNTSKDKELILKETKNAFKTYKKDKNYEYAFDDEPRAGDKDCETSYLSAFIFLELIKEYFSNLNKKNINVKQTYEDYFLTNVGGTVGSRKIYYDGGEAIMGFDVMNNPNEPDKKNKFPPHILYELYKDLNEFKVLKAIYHTIGNFTFFPRSKSYERKDEFQIKIHNVTFRENWNKSLNYLKENWEKYQFDGFCTFEDYIKMSMQQFYTVKGWEQIKEIVGNGELEKLLESKTELKKLYQNIKDCNDEINCKDYDKDDIKVINAIIKIRSKLIIMMLNGELI